MPLKKALPNGLMKNKLKDHPIAHKISKYTGNPVSKTVLNITKKINANSRTNKRAVTTFMMHLQSLFKSFVLIYFILSSKQLLNQPLQELTQN